MSDPLVAQVCNRFDERPADVSTFRDISRSLFKELSELSKLEREIIDWDKRGRPAEEFESMRVAAWTFSETGTHASRMRLFAGFVTTSAPTEGHAAEYLFDFAVGAGIAPEKVHAILMRHNP